MSHNYVCTYMSFIKIFLLPNVRISFGQSHKCKENKTYCAKFYTLFEFYTHIYIFFFYISAELNVKQHYRMTNMFDAQQKNYDYSA